MKHNYFKCLLLPTAITLVICFGLLLPNSSSLHAQIAKVDPNDPILIDTGKVIKILKSTVIELENNKAYALDNIRIPIYYQQDAKEALKKLLLNKKVSVYTYPEDSKYKDLDESKNKKKGIKNRQGLQRTHVIREEGNVWVQDFLISNGLSWAFSTIDSQKSMPTLKKLEYVARKNDMGFWGAHLYRVKNPREIKDYINSYQIVEGYVLNVTKRRKSIYINFGNNWRTDFTIVFRKDSQKPFIKKYKKFDLANLKNLRVKIRGWIEESNGPMIELTHPEQMDIMTPTKDWELKP